MSKDPPGRPPQTEFDAEAAYAAIDELRPICRTAYILYTWDKYTPQQIVDYLATRAVTLEITTVKQLLSAAMRHCLKRQTEATGRRKATAQVKAIFSFTSRPDGIADGRSPEIEPHELTGPG